MKGQKAQKGNKYRPHLLVVLEDAANREILNGFIAHHMVDNRRLLFDPVVGGWMKVLEKFRDHQREGDARADRAAGAAGD